MQLWGEQGAVCDGQQQGWRDKERSPELHITHGATQSLGGLQAAWTPPLLALAIRRWQKLIPTRAVHRHQDFYLTLSTQTSPKCPNGEEQESSPASRDSGITEQ